MGCPKGFKSVPLIKGIPKNFTFVSQHFKVKNQVHLFFTSDLQQKSIDAFALFIKILNAIFYNSGTLIKNPDTQKNYVQVINHSTTFSITINASAHTQMCNLWPSTT